MKTYTAQTILAMATQEETQALENYFGPNWVYLVLKDEESDTRYGLKWETNVVELRESKRRAREAWEAIKRSIDAMEEIGLGVAAAQENQSQSIMLPPPGMKPPTCDECGDTNLNFISEGPDAGWWECAGSCCLHKPIREPGCDYTNMRATGEAIDMLKELEKINRLPTSFNVVFGGKIWSITVQPENEKSGLDSNIATKNVDVESAKGPAPRIVLAKIGSENSDCVKGCALGNVARETHPPQVAPTGRGPAEEYGESVIDGETGLYAALTTESLRLRVGAMHDAASLVAKSSTLQVIGATHNLHGATMVHQGNPDSPRKSSQNGKLAQPVDLGCSNAGGFSGGSKLVKQINDDLLVREKLGAREVHEDAYVLDGQLQKEADCNLVNLPQLVDLPPQQQENNPTHTTTMQQQNTMNVTTINQEGNVILPPPMQVVDYQHPTPPICEETRPDFVNSLRDVAAGEAVCPTSEGPTTEEEFGEFCKELLERVGRGDIPTSGLCYQWSFYLGRKYEDEDVLFEKRNWLRDLFEGNCPFNECEEDYCNEMMKGEFHLNPRRMEFIRKWALCAPSSRG